MVLINLDISFYLYKDMKKENQSSVTKSLFYLSIVVTRPSSIYIKEWKFWILHVSKILVSTITSVDLCKFTCCCNGRNHSFETAWQTSMTVIWNKLHAKRTLLQNYKTSLPCVDKFYDTQRIKSTLRLYKYKLSILIFYFKIAWCKEKNVLSVQNVYIFFGF